MDKSSDNNHNNNKKISLPTTDNNSSSATTMINKIDHNNDDKSSSPIQTLINTKITTTLCKQSSINENDWQETNESKLVKVKHCGLDGLIEDIFNKWHIKRGYEWDIRFIYNDKLKSIQDKHDYEYILKHNIRTFFLFDLLPFFLRS